MFKTAYVDADVLLYRAGFSAETQFDGDIFSSEEKGREIINSLINHITEETEAERIQLVISDRRNFRKRINKTYKENRKKQRKPTHLLELRKYLVELGAIFMPFLEADDTIGVLATKDDIICTIDKDFKQLPGNHYNWNTEEFFEVTPEEGYIWFLIQTMAGDSTDGYHGIPKIGPVKASKIIKEARKENPDDPMYLWEIVVKTYVDHGLTEEDALMNARMAFLLREPWYDQFTHQVKLWEPEDIPLLFTESR